MSWRTRREGTTWSDDEAAADHLPWPGKRTMTSGGSARRIGWPGKPPLQMRASESNNRSAAETHDIARESVADAASSLPHAQTIQRAFGRHDLGDVRAKVGGDVADAGRSIGARAFAFGDRVAFTDTPDLHTAAHEAAHVVQQRSGVSVEGGVGRTGDRYEQHADEVANRVVAGGLAEGLLDRMTGSGSSAAVVQRKGQDGGVDDATTGAPDDSALDAGSYVTKYSDALGVAIGQVFESIPVPIQSVYAKWIDSKAFVTVAIHPLRGAGNELWATLIRTLAPKSPSDAIDRGRDGDPNKFRKPGTDVIARDNTAIAAELKLVAQELRALYAPLFIESLDRMIPEYIEARNQAFLKTDGAASADPAKAPQPKAGSIIPAHPLDKGVVEGLCKNTIAIDFDKYRQDNPKEQSQHTLKTLRDVSGIHFELEQRSIQGVWNWLSVEEPKDATAQELAKQIYGDAGLANLIVAAPPRYGFRGEYLTPGYKLPWDKLVSAEGPSSDPSKAVDADHQALAGPNADAIAKAQSKGNTGFGKDEIVQRMRSGLSALHAIQTKLTGCKMFADLAPLLKPVSDRIDQRSKDVNNDEAKALEWDAVSANQLALITLASNGLDIAIGNADVFAGEGASSDPEIAAQLASIRAPLHNLAKGYVDAAVLSEMATSAKARLVATNNLLKTYPVDMMDSMLAYLRGIINRAKANKSLSADRVAGIDKRADDIRTRLAQVRDTLVTDPATASKLIETLKFDVESLKFEATLVCNMDGCHAAIQDLNNSINALVSGAANTIGPKTQARKDLVEWYDQWGVIHDAWISDDVIKMGQARGMYERFAKDPKWVGLFQSVRTLIEDSATIEKWVSVGVMIGIAAASAGIGAAVGGGAIVGTVVEAGAFTALSTALLQSDATIEGVLTDFGVNIAMFGGMKIFSAAYKGLVGAEFAASTLGKGLQISTLIVGTAGARLLQEDTKKRAEKHEGLTDEEIKQTVLMSVAEIIGMMIGHSLGSKMFEKSPIRNVAEYDFARIEAKEAALQKKATALETSAKTAKDKGLIERAQELIKEQREVLEKKKTLLETIEKDLKGNKKVPGLDDNMRKELLKGLGEDLAGLKSDIDAHKLAELMFELVPAGGPNEFLVTEAQLERVHLKLKECGFKEAGMGADPVTHSRFIEFVDASGKEHLKITETKGDADGVAKGVDLDLPKGKYRPTAADLVDPMKHPEYPRWKQQCGVLGISSAEADLTWKLVIEGIRDGKTANFGIVADRFIKFMNVPKGKAALWSGGIDLSDYAIQQGKFTLEAQEFYKATKGLRLSDNGAAVTEFWDAFSKRFAQRIEGEVHIYLRNWDPQSVLMRAELKNLKAGVKVKYHAMDWATDPAFVSTDTYSKPGVFVELDANGNPVSGTCELSASDAEYAVGVAEARFRADQAGKTGSGVTKPDPVGH